jgi:hypothetical protein
MGATLGNIGPSASKAASGLGEAISHPVEAVKSVWALALGVLGKVIPGEQKNEELADEVGRALLDRYGSLSAVRDTVQTDPVGFVLDLSTILGGAGGAARGVASVSTKAGVALPKLAAAGRTATAAGRVLDPVSAAGSVVRSGLGAAGRRAKQTAITLTEKQTKAAARAFDVPETRAVRRVAQEMIDLRLNPTPSSVNALQRKLSKLNIFKSNLLEGKWGSPSRALIIARRKLLESSLGTSARSIPFRRAIERGLNQARKDPGSTREVTVTSRPRFGPDTGGQLPPGAILDETGRVRLPGTSKTVRRLRPMTGAELEVAKQSTAKAVREFGAERPSPGQAIDDAISHGFRKELERIAPGIGDINARQRRLLIVKSAIEDAAKVSEERALLNIPEFMGLGLLASTGDPRLATVASLGRPTVASALGGGVARTGRIAGRATDPFLLGGVRAGRLGQIQQLNAREEQRLGRPLTDAERRDIFRGVVSGQ